MKLSPLDNWLRTHAINVLRRNLTIKTKTVNADELNHGYFYQEGSRFYHERYRVVEQHETPGGWRFVVIDPEAERDARIDLRLKIGNRHTRRRQTK